MGLTPAATMPRGGLRRVWALIGVMALIAGVATVGLIPAAPLLDELWTALAVALGFAAAERWVVSLHLSERTQSMTLSELPLMTGLFLLSPLALIVARVVGILPSLVVSRRLPSYKVAFNVVLQGLETLAALAVLHLIGATSAHDAGPAALTAVFVPLVTSSLGALGVAGARAALDGYWHRGQVAQIATQSIGPSIATSGFALVALVLIETSPWLLWAPAITVLVLYGAYRTQVRLLHVTEGQGRLLSFTSQTTGREGPIVAAEQIVGAATALAAIPAAGVARIEADGRTTWLARDGDVARLDAGTTSGSALRTWPLDDEGATVLIADVGPLAGAEDVVRMLDQIVNHARVVLANATHAAALQLQAQDAEARAKIDPLTDLPNRLALMEGMDAAIASGSPFAVLLIDLDDFKEINDALGHAAGDGVLREVGHRLHALAVDVQLIGRLGGDEFALIHSGGESSARELADRLLDVIRRPFEVPPYSLQVGGSVGISLYPDHGTDGDELLKHADLAMYEAKASSSNVSVFGAAAAGKAVRQLAISTGFRTALERRRITAVYQPQLDLLTGMPTGVEALARWVDPDLGNVRPDEFIRVAEQAGLLHELTTLMLADALSWQQRWAAEGMHLQVAVNLSARSLLDSELPRMVAGVLDAHGVEARMLTLEITESSVISDPQRTMAVLARLSNLGCKISIDDFGTGYSSLAYLQELPADEVKIDKSFVLPMAGDQQATPLISGIIRLCHDLGFTVVAEGIESQAVQSVLRRMGCDAGQGFHIARPMPPEQVLGWAREAMAVGTALGPDL